MKITSSILICAIVLLQSCGQLEAKRAIIQVTDDKGKPLEDCKAYINLFPGMSLLKMSGIKGIFFGDHMSKIRAQQWQMLYPLEYTTNKDGVINALLPLYDGAELGASCYWIIVKKGYHPAVTTYEATRWDESFIVGNFQVKMTANYKKKPKDYPDLEEIQARREFLNMDLPESVIDPHLHKMPK